MEHCAQSRKRLFHGLHFLRLFCFTFALLTPAVAQQTSFPDTPQPQTQDPLPAANEQAGSQYEQHHILWVIPNYRTDENSSTIAPLRPSQKLKLAFDDSFDPSAFLVAGFFGGISMAQDQYRSFGQGASGFGKYYGAAFADLAVGNTMTEAILPIALHQDPRYFIRGEGGFWKRTAYAMKWTLITRNDAGTNSFNASEILGNGIASGISTVYYPAEDRSAGKAMTKWGQQIGVDTVFNVMKEFWPDVHRKLFRRK
jgi:hypothetical protein